MELEVMRVRATERCAYGDRWQGSIVRREWWACLLAHSQERRQAGLPARAQPRASAGRPAEAMGLQRLRRVG